MALLLCAAMTPGAAAVTADGTSARMLVPVGHTVGIKLFARGVMVVKAPESGTPADDCGLPNRRRDREVRRRSPSPPRSSSKPCSRKTADATDAGQVRREGSAHDALRRSRSRMRQGACCIGAWIRDTMAGIGTVTYYDPDSGAFGALGHGITDTDTALLMPFA